MKRVIIVDDEEFCLDVLEDLITNYIENISIVGRYSDPNEAINAILYHKPDLLLLDIEMPMLSGFDIIDKLKPYEFDVIFTTAHDNMALKAYKFGVKNYLLKPITLSDLKEALDKVFPNEEVSIKSNRGDKITLTTHEGIYLISIKDILYCEAENSYCIVHLENRKIILSKTLKDVTEMINNDRFIRVHNSFLVNADYIVKFIKSDGGCITMTNNAEIPISRARREDFLKKLEEM